MQTLTKTIYKVSTFLRQLGINFHEETDNRVIAMKQKIQELGKLEFKIEQYPDGSWTAESINVNGIITGGKNTQEISSCMRDAIFTFFGIPPHLCNDTLLRKDNEPVTLTQRVYV